MLNKWRRGREMNQKAVSLAIIILFALSIMPLTFAVDAQTANPVKLTQEIAPGEALSDSINILLAKTPSNPDIPIVAQGKPAPQPQSYALTIEIDYIEGHLPTQSVKDYMVAYYAQQKIKITFDTTNSEMIPMSSAFSNGISDGEFWALEAQYNDGLDNAANSADGEYYLPLKWVLFGTSVEGSSSTVGYTYCVGTFRDLLAGNYIYIADGAADQWAGVNEVPQYGAEAVLMMHEFGHSIGICTVRAGSEVYCSNYYCVMSYLRPENAGKINSWYYCSTHWKTKNLSYYVA